MHPINAALALPVLTLSMTLLSACGKPAAENAASANAANISNAVDVVAIPEDGDASANAETVTNAMTALLPTQAWLGRWAGPEGLFLNIAAGSKPGLYTLTIKDDLDSQSEYEGRAEGETIRFMRGGKAESLRAGTGADTGFKWLAEKQDCLIVVQGKEGYCR